MKIDVYTLCKNEETIAPFFIDYWKALAEDVNVYVYDGYSTDETRKILEQYEWIHIVDSLDNEKLDDITNTKFKNTIWKNSKDKGVDFVVVCDFDEAIFSRDPNTLRMELKKMKKENYTIARPLSFNIVGDVIPKYEEGKYLHELSQYGFNDARWYTKPILFNPDEIDEINYCPGAHFAKPTGNVKWYCSKNLFLIHAKLLSEEYFIEQIERRRISQRSWEAGFYAQKEKTKEQLKDDYNNAKEKRFSWDEMLKSMEKYYEIVNDWTPWGCKMIKWEDIK